MNITPTTITNLNRIDFVGNDSPKHISFTSSGIFSSVEVKLWVWDGDLTKPYTTNALPDIVLSKSKVSADDNYILLEISDYIKPYIKPTLEFDYVDINVASEGVFYQFQATLFNNGVTSSIQNYNTRFATLGYNWNYEGESSFTYNNGTFGLTSSNVPKYYSKYINYTTSNINISGATISNSMINRIKTIKEDKYLTCAKEPYLILFLNKQGLWDSFTPTGKITISDSIDREKYNKTNRNPLIVNRGTYHQTVQLGLTSKQSYIINSGLLTPEMGEWIEQIIYSPKVYLIQFKENSIIGPQVIDEIITVDTTLITVDSTIITIDGAIAFGLYNIARQIPVIVTDTDFTRKNRYDNKGKINYNIKFEEASNKINNIR